MTLRLSTLLAVSLCMFSAAQAQYPIDNAFPGIDFSRPVAGGPEDLGFDYAWYNAGCGTCAPSWPIPRRWTAPWRSWSMRSRTSIRR